MYSSMLPPAAVEQLRHTDPVRIVDAALNDGLSNERAALLTQIILGGVTVEEITALDIRLYAMKLLHPETFHKLGLEQHVCSLGELYEYDPPKNGLNLLKHGLGFGEVFSRSSRFGTLMVPCPDPVDGTRFVIFSALDAGLRGEHLALPLPKQQGMIYLMSFAIMAESRFRIFSARTLSRKDYPRMIDNALKNVYPDDPSAKRAFVAHCVDIVERDLFY